MGLGTQKSCHHTNGAIFSKPKYRRSVIQKTWYGLWGVMGQKTGDSQGDREIPSLLLSILAALYFPLFSLLQSCIFWSPLTTWGHYSLAKLGGPKVSHIGFLLISVLSPDVGQERTVFLLLRMHDEFSCLSKWTFLDNLLLMCKILQMLENYGKQDDFMVTL